MTFRFNDGTVKTGTPVPRTDRERPTYSPVRTYKLSPEEIEKLEEGWKNKKTRVPAKDVPVIVGRDWQSRKGTVQMKLTREIYLERRIAGVKQADICKEFKLNFKGLFGHLEQWGLKEREIEKAEVDRLRALKLGEQTPQMSLPTSPPNEGPVSGPSPTPADGADKPRRGRPPRTAQPSAGMSALQTNSKPDPDKTSEPVFVANPLRKEVTVTVTLEEQIIRASMDAIVNDIHQTAVEHGWYESPVPLAVQLALIHSEVSEALEADRKDNGSEKVAEELADVIIRTMDAAAAHKLDLTSALFSKMAANRTREYRHGGLKY